MKKLIWICLRPPLWVLLVTLRGFFRWLYDCDEPQSENSYLHKKIIWELTQAIEATEKADV